MRSGKIKTPNGQILTPAFIPVATRAAMKALTPEQIESAGAQAVLANAYHLNLRPGAKIIDRAGGETESGLKKFMNWKKPTFTDSGGFQVMSLGVGFKKVVALTKEQASKSGYAVKNKEKEQLAFVDDDGVTFKSHLDGSRHRFNPEISMQIQHRLGADIIFAFDELTTLMHNKQYQIDSLNIRTHPWAKRCLEAHSYLTEVRDKKPYQALFAVLQGANYEDLRRKTAEYMANLEVDGAKFDGFGIGGALEKTQMYEIVSWCSDELNKNGAEEKPRHLLGISAIDDIFAGCEAGIDTFDCVSPAREGRNGAIYTKKGRINLKNAKFADDFSPLEENCQCYTCLNYTKSYLNHLLKSGEMLGFTLASIHNEHFILHLVDKIRELIGNDKEYEMFKKQFLEDYFNSNL